jgi:predicted deacylase
VNDRVKAGQNLGVIKDYEGRVLQTGVSPADGVVLFLVTSLAINQGDPLMAVGA